MSLTVKVFYVEREENEPSEIRRFQWQRSSSLDQLKAKVSNVFSAKLEPELISISGKGKDGKSIKIESDSDLIRVHGQTTNQSNLKLWVTMLKTEECLDKNTHSVTGNGERESDQMCLKLDSEELQANKRDYETGSYTDCVTEELFQTDSLWPKIETETMQTSSSFCKTEPKLEIQAMKSPVYHPSELDSPRLDARFCTSYGKNSGFRNTFNQIMKDFNCCPTPSTPTPPDLPPQFVESLCTLREMGFEVENPNVLKILRQNNGNLEKTIEEVLSNSF